MPNATSRTIGRMLPKSGKVKRREELVNGWEVRVSCRGSWVRVAVATVEAGRPKGTAVSYKLGDAAGRARVISNLAQLCG